MLADSSPKINAPSSGSGPASAASRPGKYGLKAIPGSGNEATQSSYQEGLEKLKKIQGQYKTDVKKARQDALAIFDQHRNVLKAQDSYAKKLDSNRINKKGFLSYLKKESNFTIKENIVLYKGIEIANLVEGENAYEEDTSVKQINRVFKRVDLSESNKQYVLMNGAFIRRMAYRAIAPPERTAWVNKQNLQPAIISGGGELTDETKGVHFFDNGGGQYRDKDSLSDVEFLSKLSGGHSFDSFPADEKTLLAYTQIRNGVGKVLSGRSTSKDITSNHGASFSRFGEVRIDLAKVPESNVLHHYNVAAFDSGRIKESITAITGQEVEQSIKYDVDRGNLSVIRNREILFTEIPFDAINAFKESPARAEYEKAYFAAFPTAFREKFNKLKENYLSRYPGQKTKLTNNIGRFMVDFSVIGWGAKIPQLPSSAFTELQGTRDSKRDASNLAYEKFKELTDLIKPAPKSYPAQSRGSGRYNK